MQLRKIERSHNGKVGGVCAGIANAFECDTIVVRIFFVALTLTTVGMGAMLYLVLWYRLPQSPTRESILDVNPKEVHSRMYGRVRYVSGLTPGPMRDKRSRYVVSASSKAERYASIAHMPPPEPPCVRGEENCEKSEPLL